MLYLIPTPIGNLEDITYRAIRIIGEVELLLAEDSRTTGKLLSHYNLSVPMQSFHAFNEHKVLDNYITQLKEGKNIGLVSDAGTPGISDPGFLLVRAAIEEGIEITCLPGPTAIIPALVMSGLPSDKYYYEGFLPHKKGRKTRWEYLAGLSCTIVLYESPHRIVKCIKEVIEYLGPERKVCISREISKKFEENIRGIAEDVYEGIKDNGLKGEIVVCIAGISS
jgi:16S rRNA (cytidine1402-2'-O)-methyltransferase